MAHDYRPYLDWIDSRRDALIERLIAWARINSGSRNLAGLETMGQAARDAFAPLGGQIETLQLEPMTVVDERGELRQEPLGRAVRITRRRPQARLRVFLGGHLDTVFAADHPFQDIAWRDENTLNGPGVADLKGGLLVMLTALQALERSPWAARLGWEVLFNPDEEIGSPGSAVLLAEAARRNDLGLVYEPALADGTLAGERKGSGNYTAVVRGRAAHAGREHHLGRNAVVALAEFIVAVNGLNGRWPGVTVNPARLQGGGPPNIVPDLAQVRFNVRVATLDEQHRVEDSLAALVADYNRRQGLSLTLHGGFGRPPKPLSETNQALFGLLADCGRTLGIPVAWTATGGCCDGNNLAAAGLPNIDTLGVRGGKIHSADEFVLVDSLVERARLSALLLLQLATGEAHWPPRTGVPV